MKEVNRLKIKLKQSDVGQSNQNYAAEKEIGELKKRWRHCMLKGKVPPRLWDDGLVYETNILNKIPCGQQQRTGIEIVTGETPDILSELIDFEFYDKFCTITIKKPKIDSSGRRLARWLGVAHQVGSNLCYWFLLESGKVIARTTVQHIVRDNYLNDDGKRNIESFDRSVKEQLSDQNFMADPAVGFYFQDKPDKVPNGIVRTEEDYGDMTTPDTLDANDINDDVIDKYLNTELIFDVSTDSECRGCVVKHAKGTSGKPIGRVQTWWRR